MCTLSHQNKQNAAILIEKLSQFGLNKYLNQTFEIEQYELIKIIYDHMIICNSNHHIQMQAFQTRNITMKQVFHIKALAINIVKMLHFDELNLFSLVSIYALYLVLITDVRNHVSIIDDKINGYKCGVNDNWLFRWMQRFKKCKKLYFEMHSKQLPAVSFKVLLTLKCLKELQFTANKNKYVAVLQGIVQNCSQLQHVTLKIKNKSIIDIHQCSKITLESACHAKIGQNCESLQVWFGCLLSIDWLLYVNNDANCQLSNIKQLTISSFSHHVPKFEKSLLIPQLRQFASKLPILKTIELLSINQYSCWIWYALQHSLNTKCKVALSMIEKWSVDKMDWLQNAIVNHQVNTIDLIWCFENRWIYPLIMNNIHQVNLNIQQRHLTKFRNHFNELAGKCSKLQKLRVYSEELWIVNNIVLLYNLNYKAIKQGRYLLIISLACVSNLNEIEIVIIANAMQRLINTNVPMQIDISPSRGPYDAIYLMLQKQCQDIRNYQPPSYCPIGYYLTAKPICTIKKHTHLIEIIILTAN